MGGLRTDGAEHRPNLIVIDHLDGIVRSGAPDSRIPGNTGSSGAAAVLPVVVVVVDDQAERLAAIAAGGIRLVDRQLGAVQHAVAEHLLRMIVKRRQKTDANLAEVVE